MGLISAPPDGSAAVASRGFASFETNRLYAPDVLDIEDLWQWESLGSGVSKTRPFTLDGLDVSSPESAPLVVHLQGGSDAVSGVDHHVQVFVNGALVAEESFDGAVPHRMEADVPVSLLQETGNELRVLNVGDTGVSSLGHGGGAVWAGENILNSSDPASLLAQPRQPFMLTMNCLNGYFITPFCESLAEGFLKAPGKGTIASFSPSGLSLDGPAHLYHRAVMQEITGGRHPRLGDAVLAAQKTYAQTGAFPELLSVYHLFGDPAMKVR